MVKQECTYESGPTEHIYCLRVLEAVSLKTICGEGWVLLEALREILSRLLSPVRRLLPLLPHIQGLFFLPSIFSLLSWAASCSHVCFARPLGPISLSTALPLPLSEADNPSSSLQRPGEVWRGAALLPDPGHKDTSYSASNWIRWITPAISARGRQRQEDHSSMVSFRLV